jgi:WD40 repeat protein
MAKAPAERHAAAADLLKDLESLLGAPAASETVDLAPPAAPRRARLGRVLLLAAVLAVCVLAAMLWASSRDRKEKAEEAEDAPKEPEGDRRPTPWRGAFRDTIPATGRTFDLGGRDEAVAFSADGKWLAVSHSFNHNDGRADAVDPRGVRLFDCASGRERRLLAKRSARGLAFSPDNATLAVAVIEPEPAVVLIDVVEGEEGRPMPVGGPDGKNLRYLSYSAAGRLFAVGLGPRASDKAPHPERRLSLWEPLVGPHPLPVLPDEDVAWSVAFAPGGGSLATSGYDGRVRIWDLQRGRAGPWYRLKDRLGAIAFSPSGGLITAREKELTFCDVASGPKSSVKGNFYAECAAFSPDGRLLALGRDSVTLCDGRDGHRLKSLRFATEPRSVARAVAFSPDSAVLAAGNSLGVLRLWDVSAPP